MQTATRVPRLAAALGILLGAGVGQAEQFPQAWFDGPKTASELGITEFHQSPLLDDRDLPPVRERLPDDPVVIEPLRRIGKYGGTARIALDDSWQFFNWEPAVTIGADMRTTLPNLAERWDISADGRILTIYLRAGLRWFRRPSANVRRLRLQLQQYLAG